MEPAAHFHHEASSLSGNRKAMRAIEPFLTDPDDVRRVCPATLRDLLEQFLCLRAQKTACTLSYWGQWQKGAELRRRFLHPAYRTAPMTIVSLLATTPFGALAGRLDRWRRGIR
jgi:hypothetical protein